MKLSMQAKVGIVSILALIVLGGMIVWKGDVKLISKGTEIIGSFNNAGGIMPGADVRYRGYKVGKVTRIEPNPQEVKVTLIIEPKIFIPDDSSLRVAFDGLIGQKYVEIIPGISSTEVKKGSVLVGFSTLGIVDFIDVGTQNLEESKRILQSVRRITDDPTVQKAAKDTLVNLERATYEINRITADLSKALAKGGFDQTIKSLTKASDAISEISRKMDSVVSALDDPSFIADIKDTASNAKDAFDEFKKASIDASKVLKRFSK